MAPIEGVVVPRIVALGWFWLCVLGIAISSYEATKPKERTVGERIGEALSMCLRVLVLCWFGYLLWGQG